MVRPSVYVFVQYSCLTAYETTKANMINTFEYFNLLLTEISPHMEDKDLSFIANLLPRSSRMQKEYPSKYQKF